MDGRRPSYASDFALNSPRLGRRRLDAPAAAVGMKFPENQLCDYGDLVCSVDFGMRRESPFSYSLLCVQSMLSQQGHPRLRSARAARPSTTELIERQSEASGAALRANEMGDCGFLGKCGYSVHPDRPLACIAYSFARWMSPDGVESFGSFDAAPESRRAQPAARAVCSGR